MTRPTSPSSNLPLCSSFLLAFSTQTRTFTKYNAKLSRTQPQSHKNTGFALCKTHFRQPRRVTFTHLFIPPALCGSIQVQQHTVTRRSASCQSRSGKKKKEHLPHLRLISLLISKQSRARPELVIYDAFEDR